MDKPRHPHVIRTWVAGRNRHPFPTMPAHPNEGPRRSSIRNAPKPARLPAPEPHKEPET
jgi:hypothetical protein